MSSINGLRGAAYELSEIAYALKCIPMQTDRKSIEKIAERCANALLKSVPTVSFLQDPYTID